LDYLLVGGSGWTPHCAPGVRQMAVLLGVLTPPRTAVVLHGPAFLGIIEPGMFSVSSDCSLCGSLSSSVFACVFLELLSSQCCLGSELTLGKDVFSVRLSRTHWSSGCSCGWSWSPETKASIVKSGAGLEAHCPEHCWAQTCLLLSSTFVHLFSSFG
jgi:hypothetical protein